MPTLAPIRPSAAVRLITWLTGAKLRLPRPTTGYRVAHDVPVPMRDGVTLLADLYIPDAPPNGTVLIRTPYGRANLPSAVTSAIYAERGHLVVLQSVRGTFGSGGDFHPGVAEASDAADTVAWMRTQPWFDGTFMTVGSSYLGYTQWALLADPPPELQTSVIAMAPHDLAESTWSTGALALVDNIIWSWQVATQEDGGALRTLIRMSTMPRRLRRPLRMVPLREAGARVLKGRVPWHDEWLSTPDVADPVWQNTRLGHALQRVDTPVLLVTGWQDVFLTQTLDQYRELHDRGVRPALIVGPWSHGDGGGEVLRESVQWVDGRRDSGVRVYVTGAGEWRALPAWPPPATEYIQYLQPRAGLAGEPSPPGSAPARFIFDPEDPTPTIGGRLLFAHSGYRDDTALAARNDVITFTGRALQDDLEMIGVPRVELHHRADTGWCDVWVRISEVDAHGGSRNVSDGYVARTPGEDTLLRLDLDPIAHRFRAGSRIRLSIAGGSYPRFARNPGTGEPAWTASRLVRSAHEVDPGSSRLILPVTTPSA